MLACSGTETGISHMLTLVGEKEKYPTILSYVSINSVVLHCPFRNPTPIHSPPARQMASNSTRKAQ